MGRHWHPWRCLLPVLLLCVWPRLSTAACTEAEAARAARDFARAVGLDLRGVPDVAADPTGTWRFAWEAVCIFVDEDDGSVVRAEDTTAPALQRTDAYAPLMRKEAAAARASAVARAMGVVEPGARLLTDAVTTDGRWTFRWVRRIGDIRYESDGCIVRLSSARGRLLEARKSYHSQPPPALEARLDRTAAVELARRYARATEVATAGAPVSAELRIVQPTAVLAPEPPAYRSRPMPAPRSRLAWAVFFGFPSGTVFSGNVVWVDARSGEILSDPAGVQPRPPAGLRLSPAIQAICAAAIFILLLFGSAWLNARWMARPRGPNTPLGESG